MFKLNFQCVFWCVAVGFFCVLVFIGPSSKNKEFLKVNNTIESYEVSQAVVSHIKTVHELMLKLTNKLDENPELSTRVRNTLNLAYLNYMETGIYEKTYRRINVNFDFLTAPTMDIVDFLAVKASYTFQNFQYSNANWSFNAKKTQKAINIGAYIGIYGVPSFDFNQNIINNQLSYVVTGLFAELTNQFSFEDKQYMFSKYYKSLEKVYDAIEEKHVTWYYLSHPFFGQDPGYYGQFKLNNNSAFTVKLWERKYITDRTLEGAPTASIPNYVSRDLTNAYIQNIIYQKIKSDINNSNPYIATLSLESYQQNIFYIFSLDSFLTVGAD